MKRSLAGISLLFFGLSVIFWLALTVFEAALVGTPLGTQRVITFFLLVLPAAIGAVLGLTSLLHKEDRVWMAIASTLLNTLFALFHMMIILFAG
jgi:hypothetical protein